MCDKPLKGFIIGETKNGKRLYKICSDDTAYVSEGDNGIFTPVYFDNNDHSVYAREVRKIRKFDRIPCGKCMACKLEKAEEWANRCMLELKYHDTACFVTLTYDDNHVKYGSYTDPETGEMEFGRTLDKKDLQEFWKRLRKKYPERNIRYYACGEYGENTNRPHYHAIIFSYRPSDLVPFSRNEKGDPLYISKELADIWKNGNVLVGDCTHATCNYVARYVTKKVYGDLADDEYLKQGRIPPYTTMSLKPAIGKQWFEDNEWCVDRPISISTLDKGITFNVPRYFRRLYDKKYPDKVTMNDLTTDLKNDILNSEQEYLRSKNNQINSKINEKRDQERRKKYIGYKRNAL